MYTTETLSLLFNVEPSHIHHTVGLLLTSSAFISKVNAHRKPSCYSKAWAASGFYMDRHFRERVWMARDHESCVSDCPLELVSCALLLRFFYKKPCCKSGTININCKKQWQGYMLSWFTEWSRDAFMDCGSGNSYTILIASTIVFYIVYCQRHTLSGPWILLQNNPNSQSWHAHTVSP